MNKKHKVAIVTGASRGIGARVAAGLAADGYSVALVARSKDGLEKVANQIKNDLGAKSPSIMIYPLDVQDEKAIEMMVSQIVSTYGGIDLLVNNAGLGQLGTLDVSIDKYEELLRVNLIGPLIFIKAVVPLMKAQKAGAIINVSSRAGKIGFADYGAYAASKFGLTGLSESLYHELSSLGIKVSNLCPSWVDTDMVKDMEGHPEGKEMIQTEDILATIRWILSLSPAAVVKDVMIECRTATSS